MNHTHDYARALHDEKLRRLLGTPEPDGLDLGTGSRRSLRSAVGHVLIRAGTRVLPRPAERPPRVTATPHC